MDSLKIAFENYRIAIFFKDALSLSIELSSFIQVPLDLAASNGG
jgi:hypothetical protein